MAAKTNMSEEEYKECWEDLPEADRRFIRSMLQLTDLLGDRQLRFCEITPAIGRILEKADRNTLFTIITLCVGILTEAPALERVARQHERAGSLAKAKISARGDASKPRKPRRR